MRAEGGSTPFETQTHLTTGLRRGENSEEVDEALLEPEEVPATRETLVRVVKGTEEVVEGASVARLRHQGRESPGRDLEAEEWGNDGAEEARDSDEVVGGPLRRHVDGELEEAVHPHPPVRVAVEGGVEAFQEEVEMEEPHPLRRQPSSKQASLWRWPRSRFGDRGWRLES